MNKQKPKRGILMPPAVGYGLNVIVYLLFNFRVDIQYWPRVLITCLINLINWPFRTYERLFINPRFKGFNPDTPVIFIVGHWRSGTTHLHNLMSQDTQMGYCTTYQSVFPDTMFNWVGRFLFEGFAGTLMPGRRAGDNVVLGTKLPQEEEFTMGAKTSLSFYYFWMFPKQIRIFYERSISFTDASEKKISKWFRDYKLLINKSLYNTKSPIFLSKNPSHTARIKSLLEEFPKAKFVHIHRNPIEVFLSTDNFFKNMMPHLQLQSFSAKERKQEVIHLYKHLMNDFMDQRDLIPKESFVEVGYEDLVKEPMRTMRGIYESLSLAGYGEAEPKFEAYLEGKKGYQKNKHELSQDLFDELQEHFKSIIEAYGYEVPENIIVN